MIILALMLSMSIKHPDIEEFITIKQDLTKVTGANISVKVTDEFMESVIKSKDYILRYPIDMDIKNIKYLDLNSEENIEFNKLYQVITPNGDKGYVKHINAKKLWDILMKCAWQTAEPGIIFEDRMVNYSPDGVYEKFKMVSTNPCGEIPMGPMDSCRLMALNLLSFIDNPFTDKAKINEKLLYEYSYIGMRLIDNLIDLEIEAIDRIIDNIKNNDDLTELKLWEKIKETSIEGRRAGLGFTAEGDAIAMLGFKYDSDESIEAINKMKQIIFLGQLDSTIDMAIERGAFKAFDASLEYITEDLIGGNDWYKWLKTYYPERVEKMLKVGRRNISWSTVAPTGSISMLAQCSSGIEPIFMPYYERKRKCMNDNDRIDFTDKMGINYTKFIVVHHQLKEWAKVKYQENIEEWDLDKWEGVYKLSPYYKSTAPEINWKQRVKLQGVVQKYITHSISSTINLPKETTQEEIADIYIEAWRAGNKGQTIYRDGSRDGILTAVNSEKTPCEQLMDTNAPKRPKSLPCEIVRFNNEKEKWVAVVGVLDGKPYEIFTGLLDKLAIPNNVTNGHIIKVKVTKQVLDEDTLEMKTVKCSRYDIKYTHNDEEQTIEGLSNSFNEEYWNYAKLISAVLRHGMPIAYTIKLIESFKFHNDTINTWKNGVLRALRKFLKNGETGEICQKCEGKLRREGGCIICPNCGESKCG